MMFVRRSAHDAIVAAKDAEAEGLTRRMRLYADVLKKMHRENIELEARLAVFTGPRQRDARGLFVSTKEAVSCNR